jgi:hypothetical protein
MIFLLTKSLQSVENKNMKVLKIAHPLRCSCGKLKGTLQRTREINRCICYCADCQAFAHFLKREHDILDEFGGTSIIQTIPKHVKFLEGTENLACIRLTENGLLRWYAACCNTPIGNTSPNFKLPFIGLIHNCLSVEPASLDETFGSIRMHVSTQDAIGEHKPKSMGFLAGTLRVMSIVVRSRLDGSYRQTPFFVPETGLPIVPPQVLNR